jgi:hypothetical protein
MEEEKDKHPGGNQYSMEHSVPTGVLLDDDDLDRVLALGKWFVDEKGYVRINKQMDYKQYKIRLHRFVMGLSKLDKCQVDHINGNKLDNRKQNLRLVTNQQNQMNRLPNKTNISGRVGVTYNKRNGTWVSRIKLNNVLFYLGTFKRIEDAIECRIDAEIKYFGEYAYASR